MEKVDLDYLRKQWKDELGYYWGRAQEEIDEYFEMIKDTLCKKVKDLKSKSREQVLKEFSLNDDRLKDPVFIPEILDLLNYIKKINYDSFPNNWVSGDYDNKEHASYIWHSLIPEFDQASEKVLDFKVSQYNSLYEKPVLLPSEKTFINKQFEKFGLKQYDHHIDLINSIANHNKFYVILPILLRTLFENILHDIFKISLNNKHKLLYFDRNKTRVADFSVLIELLNQLSQNEFKDAVRSKLNLKIIEILDEVKEKGNLTVHEVIRVIDISYANEIHDKIDLALEALLVSYDQLTKEDKIIISSERLEKIEEKLGFRKKDEIKKGKEQKSQTQYLNKPELEKYDFLVRLIYLLQKYDAIRDYEREEIETVRELCGLSTQLNIIKFNVEKMMPPEDFPVEIIVYDKNYEFFFEPIELPNRFVIRVIEENKRYFSKDYPEYEKVQSKLEVLNSFIKYLIDRMEDLSLYSLLEEVKVIKKVLKKYIRLRKFIEYIFSDDYLNQNLKNIRNDERVMSELNWIEQNETELNDLFTVFRRKDESGRYNKILSLLHGKYLLHFRSHSSFNSSIETKGEVLESSNSQKIKTMLFMLFEEIKKYIKNNSGITI